MTTEENVKNNSRAEATHTLPRVNFRFFLFCALALCAGISITFAVRLRAFSFSSFVPFLLIVFFALRPFGWKRLCAIGAVVICFCSAGAGLAYFACERYLSGVPEGDYTVEGCVEAFTEGSGYNSCVLKSLSFDGVKSGGKLKVIIGRTEVRAGDVITFTASVSRYDLPVSDENKTDFAKDIRYRASVNEVEKTGQKDALLILNGKIYDLFTGSMIREEALVSYALLTGNSSSMDDGLLTVARQGGIAHIFAVSGLHIGIVYSAVLLLFQKPIKRYACLPALAAALCYSALCAFTVSSVRALIMCTVLSLHRLTGRKPDLLTSLSVASLLVLMISPAQYLSAGFTLSFGAVVGLALFSESLTRVFRKIRFPKFLAEYLGASLSVQIVTVPVLLEVFGYASVWAIVLNFVLLPCLPVILGVLILCTLVALITTWTGILALPAGMISLLLYVLSVADVSFVIKGFSLGAGGAVVMAGCIFLTQRFRLGTRYKIIAVSILCCVFASVVVLENCVFSGVKITARTYDGGDCVLVRTPSEAVLVIDGDVPLYRCNDFLNRTYGGRLDGVIVLSQDELDAVNAGAFLNTAAVYVKDEIPTGFHNVNVVFGDEVKIGELTFRFESRSKAVLLAQGIVTEIDLTNFSVLDADLFLGNGGHGDYYLNNGKIYSR